jgi:hypothetical protein
VSPRLITPKLSHTQIIPQSGSFYVPECPSALGRSPTMAFMAKRHQVAVQISPAVCQRLDVMDLSRCRHPLNGKAVMAQRMLGQKHQPDLRPSRVVPSLCTRPSSCINHPRFLLPMQLTVARFVSGQGNATRMMAWTCRLSWRSTGPPGNPGRAQCSSMAQQASPSRTRDRRHDSCDGLPLGQ